MRDGAGRSDGGKASHQRLAGAATWGLLRNGFQEVPTLRWSGTDVGMHLPRDQSPTAVPATADSFGTALQSGCSWQPRMSPDLGSSTQAGTAQVLDHAGTSVMATWLITGGAGGLGILFARWLLAQGMRSVSLADVQAAVLLQDLAGEAVHALISASIADVGTSLGALAAVENSGGAALPLGGIIHAAGVLRVRRIRCLVVKIPCGQARSHPVDDLYIFAFLKHHCTNACAFAPICVRVFNLSLACMHALTL